MSDYEIKNFFRDHKSKICDLTVFGEVVGKGRPRFSTRNGYPHAYTPKKTADYEKQIKCAYLEKYKPMMFEDEALQMRVDAYFKVPESASKKKKEKLLNEEYPTKKPDIDNILKSIADALNGLAYKDDSQIVRVHVDKHWDKENKVEISIFNANFE